MLVVEIAPSDAIDPTSVMLPLESISKFVVTTPVDAATVICSKPPSDLTGPLNVVLAILFS